MRQKDIGFSIWQLLKRQQPPAKAFLDLNLQTRSLTIQFLYARLSVMSFWDREALATDYKACCKDTNMSRSLAALERNLYALIAAFGICEGAGYATLSASAAEALEKGDLQLSLTWCRQAKIKAWETEQFAKVLDMLNLEMDISTKLARETHQAIDLAPLLAELEHTHDLLSNFRLYSTAELEVYNGFVHPYENTGRMNTKCLDRVATTPHFTDAAAPLSVRARAIYFRHWGLIFMVRKDWASAFASTSSFIELLDHTPWLRCELHREYCSAIGHMVFQQLHLNNIQGAKNCLSRLSYLSDKQKNDVIKSKASYLIALYQFAFFSDDFDTVIQETDCILNQMSNWKKEVTPAQVNYLLFMSLIVSFQIGKTTKAQSLCHQIFAIQQPDCFEMIQVSTRFINLMLIVEQGHYHLLEAAVKATVRYLESAEIVNSYLSQLLRHFRAIGNQPDNTSRKRKWGEVLTFEELHKDSDEARILLEAKIDMNTWLRKRMS